VAVERVGDEMTVWKNQMLLWRRCVKGLQKEIYIRER